MKKEECIDLYAIEESGVSKVKINYGSFIREQAIKNLLSAQEKIAEKGDAKALIVLAKFILKISYKFDNEMLELGLKVEDENSKYPPNECE